MKTLFTLSTLVITLMTFSQDFNTSKNTAKVYKASYIQAMRAGVITADHKLVHARENIEVIDLQSGKTVYTYDFDGKYGYTWISPDGKLAANYSQNAKQVDGRWTNGNCVLDLTTRKLYGSYSADDYWEKAAFGTTKNEVAIVNNNFDDGLTLFLYNYVEQKKLKTYFSSNKFSTVVMALAFSKDGSQLYAGIAENSINSYLNIYDKNSGEVVKKVQLKYQLDKIFVTGDYIFVSGVHGNTGEAYTSKINAKTYELEKTWEFRIQNIDPTGSYSLRGKYGDTHLYKYDLNTGEETKLADLSGLPSIEKGHATGIGPDGYYYFTEIERQKYVEGQGKTEALMVLTNTTMDPKDVHDQIVEIEDSKEEENTTSSVWSTYQEKDKPHFQIDFKGKPEKKVGETKKGNYTVTYKQSPHKDEFFMVVITDLDKKISSSKSASLAEKFVENFKKRYTPEKSTTSEITIDGQKGNELTFTKKNIYYRYQSVVLDSYAYQIIYLNSEKKDNKCDHYFESFTTKF